MPHLLPGPARPIVAEAAPIPRERRCHAVPAALALAALLYLLAFCLVPKDGFWEVDHHNKYLQMRALLESGYRSAALPYPGRSLDPDLRFLPIPPPFGIPEEGRLLSQYPVLFPLVSSVPYRAFGFAGLWLLPLAAGLALLPAVARLGAWLGMGPRGQAAAVLLASLATPLWFYSINFWEHTVALCAALWALVLALEAARSGERGKLFAAGLCMAVAVGFREELLLWAPVLLALAAGEVPRAAAPGVRRSTLLLLLGGLAVGALPVLALNFYYTGHPAGMHATENLRSSAGLLEHLAFRPVAFYRLFVALHEQRWLSWWLAAPYLLLFFGAPRVPARWLLPAVAGAAGAATLSFAVTLAGYFHPLGPMWQLLDANSLFGTSPILALAFLGVREGEGSAPEEAVRRRRLQRAVLAGALLYWAAAPKLSTAGAHWGCRFLLVQYPLMALLAADLLRHAFRQSRAAGLAAGSGAGRFPGGAASRGWLAPVALAVATGVGAQLFSLALLRSTTAFSAALNRRLASTTEEVIVTDCWWFPQAAFRIYPQRRFFLVREPSDAPELFRRLAAAGVERVRVVEWAFRRPEPPGTEYEYLRDGWLQLHTLRMVALRLRPPARPAAVQSSMRLQ